MYRVLGIGMMIGLLICLTSPGIAYLQGGTNPYQCYPGDQISSASTTPTSDYQGTGNYTPTTDTADSQNDYSEYDPEDEAWSDPSNEG